MASFSSIHNSQYLSPTLYVGYLFIISNFNIGSTALLPRHVLIVMCCTCTCYNWSRFIWLASGLNRDTHTHTHISKVGDHSRGWPEGSLFKSLLHQGVGEGATPFPGLLHFTLVPYLIMLSVKQGGIKYHFLSLWYDSTWDWTQVSRAIGEHSNR